MFTFTNAIEKDPVARGVLSSHAPQAHLQSDILAWLPAPTRSRIAGLDSDLIRGAVFDGRVHLDLAGNTDRCFSFGDCHIAGPPCVDFSPMGAGRRESGTSMLCLYVWA